MSFSFQKYLCAALLLIVCFFAQTTSAQAQPGQQPKPEDFINIRYSDLFSFNLLGADTLKKLNGHVELNQDSIFLFCDSATILNSARVSATGNFILQHGLTTTIFSDSAIYRADTKIADLFGDVSMVKGSQKLFTDELNYNTNTKVATYLTGATLTDGDTWVKSVKGYFHAATDDIFFKDSVVVVSPDFTLRSDTLQFNASSKIVTFRAPTLIVQDTAKIYTEGGFYDTDDKLAEFTRNPQYLKNDRRAWAALMRYDGNKKEVTLIGDAHFEDSTTFATADLIRYNEATDVTTLEGNAYIRDDNRIITGDTVTYDGRNESYATKGRSHIVDDDQILDANQVDYDKEREIGIARGNVIWQDTTEKLIVRSEFAEHSKQKNYLKASGGRYGRPLLIKIVDNDSLFISADTLMSVNPRFLAERDSLAALDSLGRQDTTATGLPQDTVVKEKPKQRIPLKKKPAQQKKEDATPIAPLFYIPSDTLVMDTLKMEKTDTSSVAGDTTAVLDTGTNANDDSARIILAFRDVRIFKSDLQAVCDSLSYSSPDSLFRLYRSPVIWSDTSQFSADTVLMQLANDKIDRIFLRENAFIVNSPDEVFFNQIKGKNATAFFDSSELRRVRVEGNAESVYYPQDDNKAYIGVNKTVCSEMMLFFGDNEIEGIRFYTEPKANLIPMRKADHDALKMPGFNWQVKRRPQSLDDVLKAPVNGY